MITAEKQIENIIKWLNALPKYRKTRGLLGVKNPDKKWSYCCLGVGCRVMDVRNVDFFKGTHESLIDKFCLFDDDGVFKNHCIIIINNVGVQRLTRMNDYAFPDDKDFTNQRKAMLLTLDKWIASPKVAKAVKKHFVDEIKQIKKERPFEIKFFD